jgi:hypothetical protein
VARAATDSQRPTAGRATVWTGEERYCRDIETPVESEQMK